MTRKRRPRWRAALMALAMVATALVGIALPATPAQAMQQWGAPGDIPVPADYDGDGKTDKAIWRPSSGTWWVIHSSTGAVVTQGWGLPGDIPVPADYGAAQGTVYVDGRADYAIWRPSDGTWWILYSGGGTMVVSWGWAGDVPVPGDYGDRLGFADGLGDHKADLAVWRPSDGTWYIWFTSWDGGWTARQWGAPGDIPVPADYSYDTILEPAVFRPSAGRWYILPSFGAHIEAGWGLPGDIPLPGEYEGSTGGMDIAVYRPGNGRWYLWRANWSGTFVSAEMQSDFQWGGRPGDIPVVGDYDGDGEHDWAIWRPSEGGWYVHGQDAPPTCGLEWPAATVFTPGQSYRTCHGDSLTFRTDGSIVITDEAGRVVWTPGVIVPNGSLTFQSDGNLVVRHSNGTVAWATSSSAPGGSLVLQDNGNLMVLRSDGKLAWQTDTGSHTDRTVTGFIAKKRYSVGQAPTYSVSGPASTPITFAVTRNNVPVNLPVFQGQSTNSRGMWKGTGAAFTSTDTGNWQIRATIGTSTTIIGWQVVAACEYSWTAPKTFFGGTVIPDCAGTFVFQPDGLLVISNEFAIMFVSGVSAPGGTLNFQTDGNLVIRRTDGTVAWSANVAAPGGRLTFANGELGVLNTGGASAWTSVSKKDCWTEEPVMKSHFTSLFNLIDHGVSASMKAHVEWCMVKDRQAVSGRRVLSVRQFAPTDLVPKDIDDPTQVPLPNITVAFTPNDPPEGWIGEANGDRHPNGSGYYRVAATVTYDESASIDLGDKSFGFGGKASCNMIIHGRYFDEQNDHSNDSNGCPTGPIQKPAPAQRKVVSAGNASDGQISLVFTPGAFKPIPVWLTLTGSQNGAGELTLVKAQDPGTCSSIDDTSPTCKWFELELQLESGDFLPDGGGDLPPLDPWGTLAEDCFDFWADCVFGGWPVEEMGGGGGDEETQWCHEAEWAECYFF